MANTYYNMGQIRYSSNKLSSYNTEMKFNVTPYEVIDAASNLNYRDILFSDFTTSNGAAITNLNSVYCIDLQIPRNTSYNMVFDLLLVDKDSTTGKVNLNNYQFIRRIRVPKSEDLNSEISTVVLYPVDDETIKVKSGIVRKTVIDTNDSGLNENERYSIFNEDPIVPSGDFIKYYQTKDDPVFDYYLNKDGYPKKILEYKDAILPHVWNENTTLQTLNFKIVFSNKVPSTTNFNSLLLKMKRMPDEADIQYEVPEDHIDEGNTYYGLFVDDNIVRNGIDNVVEGTKCYELKNWIGTENTDIIPNIVNGTLNSIGVWSHPDSIMAINGEEIRIGQSGYYELNDFDITNFSILITSSEDKFSMDYQYKKN